MRTFSLISKNNKRRGEIIDNLAFGTCTICHYILICDVEAAWFKALSMHIVSDMCQILAAAAAAAAAVAVAVATERLLL